MFHAAIPILGVAESRVAEAFYCEKLGFRHDPEHEGLVSVHGTYGAGEGPDWGWRITVEADGPDAFVMRMFNITPDGEEAPAVEATFTRVEGG